MVDQVSTVFLFFVFFFIRELFGPVPFSPPLLLILAFQPILFHTVLLLRKKTFFQKSRAELFDCGSANDMSKVTHVGVHHFCFARFSCFGSFKN